MSTKAEKLNKTHNFLFFFFRYFFIVVDVRTQGELCD